MRWVFQNVRARYGVAVERVQVVGASVPVSFRKLTGIGRVPRCVR